jgi:hypothetical protein
MSTVVSFRGIKFRVNPRDHNPPHVHVVGRGGEAIVNLLTLEIMEISGFTKADRKVIEKIMQDFQFELMAEWERYHGKED